ncbi:MAG: hypothetical protein AAFX06_11980 [Planctomycetota bacterium]
MMRFSRHDSPILLEVLGDLQRQHGANQLAYRAYMSAARNVKSKLAQTRYQLMAQNALDWTLVSWKQTKDVKITEAEIAKDFQEELADAEAWFEKVVADEKRWIAEGVAVDEKFNEKYREAKTVAITTDPDVERSRESYSPPAAWVPVFNWLVVIGILVAAIAFILILFAVRVYQASSNTSAEL